MAEVKLDIDYVADLARLELTPEQKERFGADLGNIVNYIAELSEVDVEGVEPTAHASACSNVWREDEVKPSYPRETMLANAPGVVNGELIRLPRVMPGSES
ncbi:MAG: Asp-tRNA(Asn)/Glu-tRNA(Gln) amidotransferase subunit GatC [Lentisphaerae bacterium]|nr:Asp-tRNA(Asn)/Glu-tRNA(Gln) amidotransferase subunit GatC [Lentisphaerota bacterium]MBR2872802.1 Asp-tRNA(Asn)/Glu-tRNA(Gln) amidotransferase subunit GatC [Lentisphaeria bacterium]